jgi:hypothetical protein
VRQVSWTRHAAQEALAITLCYAITAPLVFWLQNTRGLALAAVAGAVCLVSALGASKAASLTSAESLPYAPFMMATLTRLLLPLVFCLVVAIGSGEDLAREIAAYLILFYMVALVMETGFALNQVRAANTRNGAAHDRNGVTQPTSRGI